MLSHLWLSHPPCSMLLVASAQRQPARPVPPYFCSAVDDHPAIGVQDLATHVTGILAGQKQEAGSDLIRLSRTPHWRGLAEILHFFRRFAAHRIERRPDWSWCHGVYANTVLDEIFRQ